MASKLSFAIEDQITTRDRVQRLASDHPDWLPILRAAVTVAERTEPYGGQFAGRWVLQEWIQREAPTDSWRPGLRRLEAYKLITKAGPSTRGGRRAYWRLVDRDGVDSALRQLGF